MLELNTDTNQERYRQFRSGFPNKKPFLNLIKISLWKGPGVI